ncbi:MULTISPECIES: hypothetical protein [unclassified Streptosporangium]|uniref:hypothetical protein n=1 Tax=unclassified Streptosporangium TaxID=2632669 RepID=UPI002E28D3D4|nr:MULTISPECIES: hypothetical protein [unclassified Streptosporangium]
MADVSELLGQLFAIFATWLDSVSPIPWPLILGLLFLPFVAVLRITLWVLRGRVWPVACKYYHTQQRRSDKPCRTIVPGEWKYCRHHKKPGRVMSDKHVVVKIPRWQTKTHSGRLVDRADIRGVGFVSLLSNRETFLFYKGVAKRPLYVFTRLPELGASWRDGWTQLRELRPKDIIRRAPPSTNAPSGVADRMPRVVRATRLTLGAFAFGLGLVGASIISEGGWRAGYQYGAVAAFVLAWEAIRFGVWKSPEDEERWLRAALADTGKAVAVLLGLALMGGVVTQIGDAVATPPAAARPYAIAETLPSSRVADGPSMDSPHQLEGGGRP